MELKIVCSDLENQNIGRYSLDNVRISAFNIGNLPTTHAINENTDWIDKVELNERGPLVQNLP